MFAKILERFKSRSKAQRTDSKNTNKNIHQGDQRESYAQMLSIDPVPSVLSVEHSMYRKLLVN